MSWRICILLTLFFLLSQTDSKPKVHATIHTKVGTVIDAERNQHKPKKQRPPSRGFVVEISDVQSTNGTYVNGVRIAAGMGKRHSLRDRDVIVFGSFKEHGNFGLSEIKYRVDMKHEVADKL